MKKKITTMLLAVILSSQLITSNVAVAVPVNAEEKPALPITEQEQNADPAPTDNTETGKTSEETPTSPDTTETETPQNKQPIHILPKGDQKLEVEKIYDGSNYMIVNIDNSWLTVNGTDSIKDDVSLNVKIHLNSNSVSYDDNGNILFQEFTITKILDLEGDDNQKYDVEGNKNLSAEIKKIISAKINPCKLNVILKTENKVNNAENPVTYFYGQDKPVSFKYSIDLENLKEVLSENRNLDGETLGARVKTVQALIPPKLRFDMQDGKEITGYVAEGDKNNGNFYVEIDGTPKCVVDTTSYKVEGVFPQVSCSGTYITLKAPTGYTISADREIFETFSDSITVLYDKDNPQIEYYLRNNMQGKYKNAISSQAYTYRYHNGLPQIGQIKFELVQEESSFSETENKLLSNSEVKITVPIKKYENMIDNTDVNFEITDAISKKKISSKKITLTPQDFENSSEEYVNAVFSANVNNNTQKEMEFKLNLSNNAGSVNAGDSTISFVRSDDSETSYNILVIDKVGPTIEKIEAPSSNENYTEFEVWGVSDTYGIKSIKYNWDNLKNSENDNEKWFFGEGEPDYIDCPLNSENKYIFSLRSAKLDGKELYKFDNINDGKHTLNLIITDNAGNEHVEHYTQKIAPDITPPTVTGVDVFNGLSVVNNIYKDKSGNYYNKAVKIKVIATDKITGKTASGIKSVKLKYSEDKTKDFEFVKEGNYYRCHLDIDNKNIYEDMHIILTDNFDNEATYEFKQYISLVESNNLLLENHLPDISLQLLNGEQEEDIDISQFWYYSAEYENKQIKFDFSDKFDGEVYSGIDSIQIKDTAQNNAIIYTESFYDKTDKTSFILDISDISHGDHNFEISVRDKSGNKTRINLKFRKDFENPESRFEVISPKIINEEWFDGQKNLTISVIAKSNDDDIKKAEITVKGLEEYHFEFDKDAFVNGIKEISLDNINYKPDNEHKYTIIGKVWDESGNVSEYEPLTLSADIDNPQINSVSVSKTQNAIDQIINVLTFGVYSNQKILLTADVSDNEYDSGIKSVTIEYENNIYDMYENENHQYTFEFPSDADVFSGNVTITAIDETGHSTVCKNFSGTDDEGHSSKTDNTFIMIENGKPELEVETPPNQTNHWYNDDDSITLKISDKDSGIRKILFKDNEDIWSNTFSEEKQTEFQIEKDISTLPEGKHQFYIDVFDNSGNNNTHEYDFNIDRTSPVIDNIRLLNSKGEDVTDKITRKTFGNYYNDGLKVIVSAHDPENDGIIGGTSGIKDIVFSSEQTLTQPNYSDDSFSFELPLKNGDSDYNISHLTITDNAENTQVFYLKDFIGNMTSENILIEKDLPLINLYLVDEESETKINTKNTDYYGKDKENASIKFSISDVYKDRQCSGISSIKISLTDTDSEKTVYSKTFNNKVTEDNDFEQKLSKLKEGKYRFKVDVEDNSQNTKSVSYEFYKDFIFPQVKTDIVSQATESNGKKWFKGDENIKIKFLADDTNIQSATITVSGKNGEKEFNFTKSELNSGSKTLTLNQFNLPTDEENRYIIKGIATDKAGNSTQYEEMYLYRDFETPNIEYLTIAPKADSIGQVLNILDLGVYSNNTVRITAHVTEPKFDSGIKQVTISYDGLSKPIAMDKKEGDNYTFDLVIPANVFKSNIKIVAQDNIGKTVLCKEFSDKDRIKSTASTFIVLEKIQPQADIQMPAANYKTTSGEKWYNMQTDKKITITAGDVQSGMREIKISVNGNKLDNDSKGTPIFTEDMSELYKDEFHDTLRYELSMQDMINKFGIPNSKRFDISVSATDNSGNVKNVSETYYIDNIKPKVQEFTISLVDNSNPANIREFIKEFEYGFYYLKDFKVTVLLSDTTPGSNMKRIQYKILEYDPSYNSENHLRVKKTGIADVINNRADIGISANFKGQIYVTAIDNVGNESDEVSPKAFVVDTPDVHNSENHFETAFENQEIYNKGVSFSINVVDKVSGIKSISTSISYRSEIDKDSRDNNSDVINIDDSGKADNDSWKIRDSEVNLVTKMSRDFVFQNDVNDLEVVISLTDRAGNTSTYTTKRFTIDQTEPKIDVSFKIGNDNVVVDENDNYFNNDLVATVTVTERNLNGNVSLRLGNSDILPSSSQTSGDTHTYSYVFEHGDYRDFVISAIDIAGHSVSKTFTKFYVDTVAPKFSENVLKNFPKIFRLNKESQENGRRLTVNISEPHLAASYFIINGDGVNKDTVSNSINYTFSNDGVYRVEVYARDMSGNVQKSLLGEFEIDNTLPQLSIGDTSEETVFSDSNEAGIFNEIRKIKFTDKNINKLTATVNRYSIEYDKDDNVSGKVKKADTKEYTLSKQTGSDEILFDLEEELKIKDENGNTIGSVYPDESCVYQVEISAADDAKNNSGNFVFTFYIIENEKYMIYLPENDAQFNENGKKTIDDSYIFDGKPISTENIKDILICMLIRDTDSFEINIKDTSIEEKTLNVPENLDINTNNEGMFKVISKKDIAEGISLYFLDIKKEYFTTRFFKGDSTEVYINANVIAEDGDILKTIKVGSISIDNEEPFGDYSTEFKKYSSPQWYDGVFDTDKVEIIIDGLSKDVYYEKCVFKDNEQVIPSENIYYDREKNQIKITIGNGSHKIESTIYDESDNHVNLDELNIYVGNRFEKPEIKTLVIVVSIILSVLVIGAIITIIALRKRR